MKIRDVTRHISERGWATHKEKGDDPYAKMELSDRIISIIYRLRSLPSQVRLEMSPSLTTSEFSIACSTIRDIDYKHEIMMQPPKGLKIAAPEISVTEVDQGLEDSLKWAGEQDLQRGLETLAALPTNSFGAFPLRHLGALAVLKDVDRLRAYHTAMLSGDRLGFVNYITIDHVGRALAIAESA